MNEFEESGIQHEVREQEFEGVVGYFTSSDTLREAVLRARDAYFTDVEVYLPVDDRTTVDLLIPGRSPVGWIGLAGGVAGAVFGLWLAIWTSWDYPLVTGGKPIASFPPFLVVAFEVMVLVAAAAVFVGFVRLAGLPALRPGSAYRQDLVVDRFALLIRCPPYGAPQRAEQALRAAGALEVRPIHHEDRGLLGEVP